MTYNVLSGTLNLALSIESAANYLLTANIVRLTFVCVVKVNQ